MPAATHRCRAGGPKPGTYKRKDSTVGLTPSPTPTTETLCAYCGKARAYHLDHVVSRVDRRKLRRANIRLPRELMETVPSCGDCNWRKLTLRLVPLSWAEDGRMERLNALVAGVPFRAWDGDPSSPAITGVHK